MPPRLPTGPPRGADAWPSVTKAKRTRATDSRGRRPRRARQLQQARPVESIDPGPIASNLVAIRAHIARLGFGSDAWSRPSAGSIAVLGMSLGLLGVALSFAASRAGHPWAGSAFWAGLLLTVLPVAVRLFLPDVGRGERVALLLAVGGALYAIKVMHSPNAFALHDELQHLRTLNDIATTGELFRENPLLRTSPLFPGMELAAASLVSISGISHFAAGILVIGASRVLLLLALYLLFERLVRDERVAAVGVLFYMANPSFLFFDAQFSYESFALPFAALTLYAVYARSGAERGGRVFLTLMALLGAAIVTFSHHVTSYLLAGTLAGWAVLDLIIARRPRTIGPRGMAVIAVTGAVAWLLFVAGLTLTYLAGSVGLAVVGIVELIVSEGEGRQLFEPAIAAGVTALPWERATSFAAVGLTFVLIGVGLWVAYRGLPRDALTIGLGLAALAYPATHLLRFSRGGAELSSRVAATTFVAVALFVALAVVRLVLARPHWWRMGVAAAATTVFFIGYAVLGWPAWQRLPGPYLLGADSRSIEEEGLTAASWALDVLGPGGRMGADGTNNLLMGVYGLQYSIWYQTARIDLSPVYFAPRLGVAERQILAQGNVHFLVVDWRLTEYLPQTGAYFDAAELRLYGPHLEPMSTGSLEKFDRVPDASRIFDSGNIRVFDVRQVGR